MSFLMVVAHGAVGPLDEIVELGIPLILLVGLYWWSNRKPKEGPKDAAAETPAAKEEATE